MSAFEKVVTDTISEKQPPGTGAAIDIAIIMQLMTFLMQFIQNCPFGSAKAAIKEGGTPARVATFNAVKKSGYSGNAVELTEALVAKGKAATDDEIDETVAMAYSMMPLSKFMILVVAMLCFATTAVANDGPFPVVSLASVGPFPVVIPDIVVTPQDATPAAVGGHDANSPTAVSDSRPVLEILVPSGDWCTYCNWWKERGDDGLPFQLKEVVTKTEPKYGYPTFRVPHLPGGSEWFIGNSASSESGAKQLVKVWSRITGHSTASADVEQVTGDAAASPTPYSEIARAFEEIELRPDQKVADLGCGDGRVLMVAVEQFHTQEAIGVEIDPVRADATRDRVSLAGVSDKIEISTGDATKMDVEADVVFVHLYDDTLKALSSKLSKYDKVISYRHPVPGLQMTKSGNMYYYDRKSNLAKTETKTVTQLQWQQVWQPPYQTPGYECGDRGCGMCYGQYVWKQVPVEVQVASVTQPTTSQPAVQCSNCGR